MGFVTLLCCPLLRWCECVSCCLNFGVVYGVGVCVCGVVCVVVCFLRLGIVCCVVM